MKAITCSQCGALIKNFTVGDKFADCDYCHAKIPINKDKVLEVSERPKKQTEVWISPYDLYVKKKEKYSTKDDPEPQANILGLIIVTVGIVAFLVFILIILFSSPAPVDGGSRRTGSGTETQSVPGDLVEPVIITETTPVPNVSFTSYVKYNTSLGAEHIELPTIEADQLATFDHKELEATVFKQKRIHVRITINLDGEVTDATALNGHDVLKESSVRAARKSLFSSRKREGKSTLTYIYLLSDEE